MTREQEMDAIKKLCVRTYLTLLGYNNWHHHGSSLSYPESPLPGDKPFAVYHYDNQFHLGTRREGYTSGGVLDLAAAIFGVSKDQIFDHPQEYKIDQLVELCEGQSGPQWEELPSDDEYVYDEFSDASTATSILSTHKISTMKNNSLAQFKQHFRQTTSGETWSDLLDAWLECGGQMHLNNFPVPKEWEYRPGLTPVDPASRFHAFFTGRTQADLVLIGTLIYRYVRLLERTFDA